MDLLQIFVLAIVQGLTEFLPISSSAHLILVPVITHWQDQGLAFDIAVHVGTLSAVVWYFRKDLTRMSIDWLSSLRLRRTVGESRLAWAVILGTIPVGLAGLLLHDVLDSETFRSARVIAWATIVFGLLLWFSDRSSRQIRNEHSLQWKDIAIIGLAQALALIPGTSRSGITMTAGLLLGLTREAAARFSFLLSIPVIILAGGYKSVKLIEKPDIDWLAIGLGVVLSALTAYLCIYLFLKLLERIGMLPFVIYRLLLGGVLLYVFS